FRPSYESLQAEALLSFSTFLQKSASRSMPDALKIQLAPCAGLSVYFEPHANRSYYSAEHSELP
ncbi:MAG: hypothetical protein J1G30_00490, partial [Spirochaetales bacterium]|nr:hypothetical protein [Spirochaetales bacterium]